MSKRSLSLAVVMVAEGLGPFLFIPLIAIIVTQHGLKFMFLCFFIASVIIFFISFLINDESSIYKSKENRIKLASKQLIENAVITFSHFLGCASHSIVLIYLFSYMLTIFHGNHLVASSILSTIGISSLLSRGLIPSVAMAIKGKNALLLALLFQAIGASFLFSEGMQT